MLYKTLNPATGLLERLYEFASEDTLRSVLCRLTDEQRAWRRITPADRASRIASAARALAERKAQIADAILREVGKPRSQAEAEIDKTVLLLEWAVREGPAHLNEIPVDGQGIICFEPLGVVLCIMPWNYPVWQSARFALPALLAGNAVVLKPAPNVPETTILFAEVLKSAGLPFAHLFLDEKQVSSLVADPSIAAVSFTGSVRAGKILAARAGLHLKKSVFELGGSDPYLVLADADVPEAARICAQARLVNSGQSCIAAKRFLVHHSLKDAFEQAFTSAMDVPAGMPEENPVLGPLARDDLRHTLHEQVTSSVQAGAKLLLGGSLPDTRGFFYPATVLSDVTRDMRVWKEETFGPVAAIAFFETEQEAVALANDSLFGLGAAVFSRDPARALAVAREIDSGMAAVNQMLLSDPRFPFGGIKESGFGRELSGFGVREFVNVRTLRT